MNFYEHFVEKIVTKTAAFLQQHSTPGFNKIVTDITVPLEYVTRYKTIYRIIFENIYICYETGIVSK